MEFSEFEVDYGVSSPSAWLSLQEASAYSKFADITLRRAIKAGTLPAYRLAGGRQWRLRRGDLDRWLRGDIAAGRETESQERR